MVTAISKSDSESNKGHMERRPLLELCKPNLIAEAVAVAIFTFGVFSTPAYSATITVNSNLDDGTDCTLRDSVVSINSAALEPGCSISSGVFGENDEINFAPTLDGATIGLNGAEIVVDIDSTPPAGAPKVHLNASSLVNGISVDGGHLSRILYIRPAQSAEISNVDFLNGGNGAIQGTIRISDCEISGTTGGPAVRSNFLRMNNCVVSNNSQSFGRGTIYAGYYDGFSIIENSIVENNYIGENPYQPSDGGGAGVYSSLLSLLFVRDSIFRNNYAKNYGGAIRGNAGADINIENSTFYDNSAGRRGGAIHSEGLTMTNSTVSGNSARLVGGGIFSTASTGLLNSTLTGNSASFGSGIRVESSLFLNNTIIANSGAGYECSARNITIIAPSIVEDGSCRGVAISGDPGLLPLTDNGGPTPTHALSLNSIARDAGENSYCQALDQRGEARIDRACDIGAFELKPVIVTSALDDGTDCTLRDATDVVNEVETNNGCDAPGPSEMELESIVFDSSLGSSNIALTGGQLDVLPDKKMSIFGASGAMPLTIDGGGVSRLFKVDSAELNLNDLVLANGLVSGQGGAIMAEDSELTFFNVQLNNSQADAGGGLFADNSVVALHQVQMNNNSAMTGAGIYLSGGAEHAFTSTDLISNIASGSGGGVYLNNAAELTMSDARVISNDATSEGGGFFVTGLSSLNFDSSEISFNTAQQGAGGQATSAALLNVVNSTVSSNQAMTGGGLSVDNTIAQLYSSTIANNQATLGAGIYLSNTATASMQNMIVADSLVGPDCSTSNSTFFIGPDSIVEDGSCSTAARIGDPKLLQLAINGGRTRSHALDAKSLAIGTGLIATCPELDQRGRTRLSGDSACDVGSIESNPSDSIDLQVIYLSNGKVVVIPN